MLVANLYVTTEHFLLCFLNVYLVLTTRLSVTSSMRCTCKKDSVDVLLLVAIAEGHLFIYLFIRLYSLKAGGL